MGVVPFNDARGTRERLAVAGVHAPTVVASLIVCSDRVGLVLAVVAVALVHRGRVF